MATLLPANGEPRPVTPTNGHAFVLAELQFFVGGDIELLALGDGRLMYLNEHGKYLKLPSNHAATLLTRDRLSPDDVIVGDVVVCTLREAGEGVDDDLVEEAD